MLIRTCALVLACAAVLLVRPVAAQPVLITAATTVGPTDTTITATGSGTSVPLASAQITVQGATLTMNGRFSIASIGLQRDANNLPGVLTHTPGFTYDYSGGAGTDVVNGLHLIVSGGVTVQGVSGTNVGSAIDASGRGFISDQGPGAGQPSTNGSVGGTGGGFGGSGGSSLPFVGGNPYGSYSQPIDFGSGGGDYVGTPAGAGGGRVRLQVTGSVNVDGAIRSDGQQGGSPAGSGSGGAVWITAASLSGAGVISANGADGGGGTWGPGGGGRIVIGAGSSSFSGTVSAYGGNGGSNRAGPGTIYYANAGPQLVYDNGGGTIGLTALTSPLTLTGNLVVRNAAGLSQAAGDANGLQVTVTGNVTVDATSTMDVSGRGFGSDQGPGAGQPSSNGGIGGTGGGYGGSGVSSPPFIGGYSYGSFTQPTDLGSGGGDYVGNSAGAGGGRVRMQISGALDVEGAVHSDGVRGSSAGGSGSGGSVWITAGSVTGAGAISANGGDTAAGWGAGGGGRVSIGGTTSTFSGTISAFGGNGGNGRAGAGTVYYANAVPSPQLVYDNGGGTIGLSVLTSPLTVTGNLIVRNAAGLTHVAADANGLQVTVTGNATIDSTSRIDASGRGFGSDQGTGAGQASTNSGIGAAGGGYGGSGVTSSPFVGGNPYGSFTQPTDLGSGGGDFVGTPGGAGGGRVRLQVSGGLDVEGAVRSDGQAAGSASGSGSGGSVWITAGSLTGAGAVSANGGDGAGGWGAGGGGRVSIGGGTTAFSGGISAFGGNGGNGRAGAGTVYFLNAVPAPQLVYDNGGGTIGLTLLTSPLSVTGNLVVRNAAGLSHIAANPSGLQITVSGDVTIDGISSVDASGRGFGPGQGPGVGADASNGGCGNGGGSHGGTGGSSNCGNAGGPTYGSITNPTLMGSGSGMGNGPGAAGGGVIQLTSGGTVTVLAGGVIASNGQAVNTSAGAGGSVWITCQSLSGAGLISANGGDGGNSSWGGGGGGRVAVYYTTSSFSGPIQARGGNGARAGAGTCFTKPASTRGTITVDNGTAPFGEATTMSGPNQLDANLVVANYAVLGPPRGDATLSLNLTGDVTIEANGVIGADGRGFTGGQGPGVGANASNGGCGTGGGGHGGIGGASNCGNQGGATYDSATTPDMMGSGSGTGNGPGAAGGGVIRLTSAGTITIQTGGAISANGESADSSAGAGGSVWLTCHTLDGAGLISANGANGGNSSWGGGGGGRVAVYACVIGLPLSNITVTAGTGGPVAQAGTSYVDPSALAIVSNISSPQACSGSTVTFQVQTLNATSFQWRRNNVPTVDGPTGHGTVISGSSTNTLTLTNIVQLDNGQYTVAVANACGNVVSSPVQIAVCYVNCDCSTTPPVLNANDFQCFLNKFASNDPYANCDGSSVPPVLNANDFQCFLNAYAVGCP